MASERYVCTLDKELRDKARSELLEKDEWRQRDIDALRMRVLNNKALTSRQDAEFLIRFLRARKFDYERSYALLESYYRMRAQHPHIYRALKPSAVEQLWADGVTQVLPHPDKFGRRIIYYRPGKLQYDKYSVDDFLKAANMNLEHIIRDEVTQVNGVVVISNGDGVTWDLFKHAGIERLRLMPKLVQEAFPIRMKVLHMVNQPEIFGYVFNLVKPFLKEKLRSRMNFHGAQLDNLVNNPAFGLDTDMLPSELGGSLPSGDELAHAWKKTIMAEEAYFEQQLQYKMTLERGISDQTAADGSLEGTTGVAGTFKRLNVD